MLFLSVPGLATCPQNVVYTPVLGYSVWSTSEGSRLRGFATESRRKPSGLVRPRPPLAFFLVEPEYLSGMFRQVGRSSSQRPFRLAREARPRVCIPECQGADAEGRDNGDPIIRVCHLKPSKADYDCHRLRKEGPPPERCSSDASAG